MTTVTQLELTQHVGESQLAEVLALARANRRTLGFLPDQAFRERAHRGHLVVATEANAIVGYVLYDTPASIVKLVHLCVRADQRGRGISRLLFDAVVEANPGCTGVVALCRRDYRHMERIWESLGMAPSAEKPGKSLAGSTLVAWRKRLGGPDLFDSLVLEPTAPVVVLDSNVVIDLYASPAVDRADRESSLGLMGDWMQPRVIFAVSPQLDIELNRTPDAVERRRQRGRAQHLTRLRTKRPGDSALDAELEARFGAAAMAADASLATDICHLADAIHAGAAYFVTNDASLIRRSHPWTQRDFGILVLRPYELVQLMCDPDLANAYEPRLLRQTEFTSSPVTHAQTADIESAFLNYAAHEKGSAFRGRLRAGLANPRGVRTEVLSDPSGQLHGLVVAKPVGDVFQVSLMRVASTRAAPTIAFQLARHLRELARKDGCTRVVVVDKNPQETVVSALASDGFRKEADDVAATTIDEMLTVSAARARSDSRQNTSEPPWSQLHELSSEGIAEVERRFWPLKIWDQSTPCFVFPIRPKWSMPLFGYPDNLLRRSSDLGLSRQHVYYRSTRNNPITAVPARVLWYVSGGSDSRSKVQQVFAYSRIVSSEVLDVGTALRRYSRLGVYERRDLAATASPDGLIHVVQFEDTELLARPAPLHEFRLLANAHGIFGEFQSPRAIPASLLEVTMSRYGRN